MSTATATPETLSSPTVDSRRTANYKPNIWNSEFLESLKRDQMDVQDKYEKIDKETLSFEVKNMMADEDLELMVVFQLIDSIQRLGLGIDFDSDIKRSLRRIACNFGDLKLHLHATALGFRLLRQNGNMVSQDVFKQFMSEEGKFKLSLCNDIDGMISLYEASYVAYEEEHLLEEAKAFTSKHLAHLCLNEHKLIANQVNRTLDLPLRYRMPRLEARHYIEASSTKNDSNTKVVALCELAKLDFNMTQLIYQEDLQDMTRWWKELGLSNKLSFARDRLMECFFWGTGTTPRAELSYCRKALTKVCKFITIIDDIYDVYGHMHELELFTNAVERWDVNVVDDLPYYMKLTFLALYNTVNEIGYEVLKQKGYNCVPFLKKAWEDVLKSFLVEAKWCHYKQTPTFEEYINNGWVSASGVVALTHAFFFVSQDITPEALDCFKNNHDILRLPSMVFRLSNDLATYEDEIERGETANAISCYAKKAGVSLEDSREHISKMIDESWKRLNEIQVDNKTPFSDDFIETALNLARTSQCAYQQGDGHGSPELIKKHILSIFVDPIK
ncbi:hypothetical protein BVRB_4g075540 [Beta vulgaris subsp. vulgaris]|nr:hypothetical protein BVRB_4g075540 [Beta vulgaris subsp. vulgaris]